MDSVRQNNAHAFCRSKRPPFPPALIAERCAQGRYGRPHGRWPAMMFLGCALMVVGTVLLLR
jgi:hypothetical protein